MLEVILPQRKFIVGVCLSNLGGEYEILIAYADDAMECRK